MFFQTEKAVMSRPTGCFTRRRSSPSIYDQASEIVAERASLGSFGSLAKMGGGRCIYNQGLVSLCLS